MMDIPDTHPVLTRVRRALGRSGAAQLPPTPPVLDERVVRLVRAGTGLPELFMKRAGEMKMLVEAAREQDLVGRIAAFLVERNCRRVMLSETPLLVRLGAADMIGAAGLEARRWGDMSADDAYDFDAGVTDVDYGVAETGTLVVRHRPEHGRLLSLVPFVHVAVVEARTILPDLIDLFDALARDGTGSGVTMISGPSKTADIEMNTVIGVHGPNVVKAFVVS